MLNALLRFIRQLDSSSILILFLSICLNIDAFAQAPEGYVMSWNDEFNGTQLDASKWQPCPEWFRQGGSYWSDNNYALTGNGKLKLTVTEQNGTVFCGAIRTRNLFDQKQGYFEVRCKVPQMRGGWAAFWLMPYQNLPGNTGVDGTEMDVFESINGWNGKINHALHWDGYGASHQKSSISTDRPDLYDKAYHKFGLLWTDTEYVFYIDGAETWRTSAGGISDVNQYLKLTMEVSGDTWAGNWNDQVQKPIDWLVDYVRVYEKSAVQNYTCDIRNSDYGTITKSPDQVSYASGVSLTIDVQPDNGYIFSQWFGTIESHSSTLDLVMNQDYFQIPEIIRQGEMLQNSQFLDGSTGWIGKGATMSVADGVHLTEIPGTTANFWDIQLIQSGLHVEEEQAYTFTFKASAESDRSIRAVLGMNQAPWTSFGGSTFNLTTTAQLFTFDSEIPLNENSARVVLNLGQYSGDVMVEEVSLVKKDIVLSTNETQNVELSIFPNPTTNQVSIHSEKEWQQLEVIGPNGHIFYTSSDYELAKIVDLSLPIGIYHVRLMFPNKTMRRVLLVK